MKTKIKNYLVKTLNGMALGLFSSLITGLILRQIGELINVPLLVKFGKTAELFMGAAIGVGVAHSLSSSPLVIFSSAIVGALGTGGVNISDNLNIITLGEPVGAFISSLIACEAGNRINGKSKINIILTPVVTIITGGLISSSVAPVLSNMMRILGSMINSAATLQPVLMGMILSVLMGMLLTLPLSSAAIAISLNLSGIAAGASLVGCCCNMIGFAVISFRENGVGGLISQGLGTSMIQVPNIIKNPKIWIPSIISSAILGPVSTSILKMEVNSVGAGMGSSALVGQIATISVMGIDSIKMMLLMHFILPAIISLSICEYMRKKGHIKYGDLKI